MEAFREVNQERGRCGKPHVSEELLLIIQTYLRMDGEEIGKQTYKNVLSEHVLHYHFQPIMTPVDAC